MSIILSTENLEKRYKGVTVLKDININVTEGGIYGLLGPNGAGKSTLLKIIAGIARASEGRVLLKGELWSRKNSRDIGYLIEEPVIYENLTAYENLKVIAIQCSIPERKIPEVLTRVGLKDTGRKTVKKFSMGMKQRLGIALALLREPGILILDEPTNGLDPYGIKDMRELIKSFSLEGITVIVASHILQEVALMAGRVGIIHEGELCYEGDISGDTNLEDLFMEVTRRERRENND